VEGAVSAVAPVIEVDAVFAVATARSPSHTWILRLGSHAKSQKSNRPPTCKNSVELRGFEPLTPSMRTRCATGLRYSPENLS
jgi:hypothetical protein